MEAQKSMKRGHTFLIVAGILLVAMGVVFIFLGDYKYAYAESILGLTFIIGGLLFKPAGRWKELPTGMKILVIILWYDYLSGLWGVYRNFGSFDILLGFPLQFPISAIVKPIMLFITLFTLIAVYGRIWRGLILWLQGFSILNFLAGGVWMMITPLNDLFALSGQKAPAVITQQAELLTKLIVSFPMLIGLAVGIIFWIYIFRKKDYFQDQQDIYPKA